MNDNIFLERLTWFKQNEKPESVLVIANNHELIKIIIAWTNLMTKSSDNLTDLNSNSENEKWKWLWINSKYSLTELKIKAGVPYSESVLE
jgi:hypothetical protein